MRLIKGLVEHIEEELHDADKYIKCAVKHKHDGTELDALFAKLASAELEHATMLHEAAVKEIDKMRSIMQSRGTPIPDYMIEYWDDEHEEYVERMSILKHSLEMVRR